MFRALQVTGIMAQRIRLRSLTKLEQKRLWDEFKPLKDALSVHIKGFRGGWKKLNLKAIRATIKDSHEIKKAERAMAKLIDHNTAMVVSEAHRKYRYHKNLCPDDLVQAGHIGLIYALYLYEPLVDGKEIKFSSYAYRWIKALIQEEVHGDKTIKPPSNERDYHYRFVTSVTSSSEGDTVDVFDLLGDSESELLSTRCAQILDPSEYIALTEEPLMAALQLNCDFGQIEQLKERGKAKVLATL